MTRNFWMVLLAVGMIVSAGAGVCEAQKGSSVPAAPIPRHIPAAKKVFIANGGGDESLFDTPQFSGGPDRLYNEFYSAMKAWGRYELVSTPSEANLVFEVRLTMTQILRPDDFKVSGPSYDAQFRLTIQDVPTHTE